MEGPSSIRWPLVSRYVECGKMAFSCRRQAIKAINEAIDREQELQPLVDSEGFHTWRDWDSVAGKGLCSSVGRERDFPELYRTQSRSHKCEEGRKKNN